MPSWGRAVFRWLQTVPVSIESLTAPPPTTQAKADMSNASLSDLDFSVIELLKIWPDPYLNASEIFKVFNNPILAGPLHFDLDTNVKYVKRAINDASTGYKIDPVWDGTISKGIRPRVLNRFIGGSEAHVEIPLETAKDTKRAHSELRIYYASRIIDLAGIAEQISDALQQDDRI
jgi:hypothetical protein